MTMRTLVAVAAVVGCSPATAPPATLTTPSVASARSVTPAASASVAATPCETPRLLIERRVEISCWPNKPCSAPFAYTIDNCTDKTLGLRFVHSRGTTKTGTKIGAGDGPFLIEPPLVIAPYTKRIMTFPPGGKTERVLGDRELSVGLVDVSDPARELWLEAPFELVDPGLEKAKAECLARGDDWGEHGGLFSNVGCAAVMKDAGKVCHDERDCEGFCFLESEKPVSPTEKLVTGRCTRLKLRFGCHTAIGKTNAGLVSIKSRFPKLCVD